MEWDGAYVGARPLYAVFPLFLFLPRLKGNRPIQPQPNINTTKSSLEPSENDSSYSVVNTLEAAIIPDINHIAPRTFRAAFRIPLISFPSTSVLAPLRAGLFCCAVVTFPSLSLHVKFHPLRLRIVPECARHELLGNIKVLGELPRLAHTIVQCRLYVIKR